MDSPYQVTSLGKLQDILPGWQPPTPLKSTGIQGRIFWNWFGNKKSQGDVIRPHGSAAWIPRVMSDCRGPAAQNTRVMLSDTMTWLHEFPEWCQTTVAWLHRIPGWCHQTTLTWLHRIPGWCHHTTLAGLHEIPGWCHHTTLAGLHEIPGWCHHTTLAGPHEISEWCHQTTLARLHEISEWCHLGVSAVPFFHSDWMYSPSLLFSVSELLYMAKVKQDGSLRALVTSHSLFRLPLPGTTFLLTQVLSPHWKPLNTFLCTSAYSNRHWMLYLILSKKHSSSKFNIFTGGLVITGGGGVERNWEREGGKWGIARLCLCTCVWVYWCEGEWNIQFIIKLGCVLL